MEEQYYKRDSGALVARSNECCVLEVDPSTDLCMLCPEVRFGKWLCK